MTRRIIVLSLMLHLTLVAAALRFPFHKSDVDHKFVVTTLAEIYSSIDYVNAYSKNPPLMTSGEDDLKWHDRAVDDMNAVAEELDKYQHHKATKEDVRSALSQLKHDLANVPDAHWPEDLRSQT